MIPSRTLRAAFSCCLLLGAVQATNAQPMNMLPDDIDATSLARLPYLERNDMEQKNLDTFNSLPGLGEDGVLSGPLAFAAYNPTAAKALFDLHNAAVGDGTLDAHARELAILVACRATNYDLEWNAHVPAAERAGVGAHVIDVVRNYRVLTGLSDTDATIIRFGRELFNDKSVASDTFAKAVEIFGEHGTMDLVAVMNTYAVSGFYAIAVDEHMPAGEPTLRH